MGQNSIPNERVLFEQVAVDGVASAAKIVSGHFALQPLKTKYPTSKLRVTATFSKDGIFKFVRGPGQSYEDSIYALDGAEIPAYMGRTFYYQVSNNYQWDVTFTPTAGGTYKIVDIRISEE